MDKKQIIEETKEFVKKSLEGESTGHDWWHCYRVWKTAVEIAEKENADLFVVELAALLHDIADWKLNATDESENPRKIREWLENLGVDENAISHVADIVLTMSYKGPTTKSPMKTLEGMIVQDADRLDALGAIGIARCFATGQKFGQVLHDPNIKPQLNISAEEYKKQYTGQRKNTTVNHFYEKLFLLKGQFNTEAARQIAEERHKFMEQFLDRFYKEWEGER